MLAMSFLTANFKWILLAVVLFAMLIVGYVADKTDFGHKKTSKKEIENPNKVEELDLDNLKGKTLSDMVGGSNEVSDEANISDDLNAPFGDTPNTEATDINNVDALYAPIGDENLNVPFGDTTVNETVSEDLTAPIETNAETNNEMFNNDIFAPIGEETVETPIEENVVTDMPVEENIIPDTPVEENIIPETPAEELIPEVPVETIPENEEVEVPTDIISEPVIDTPVEENIIPETPVENTESEELIIPTVEELEVPVETPVETIEVPMEEPAAEPIKEENIFDVLPAEEVPSVETVEVEEAPKKKKKNKKSKEKESNKYSMDFEEEIVPEVITEKFNGGNNDEITTEDDIWKF